MSLECFRVFFAFICFCSMIESAANEDVVVVAMKNLLCDDLQFSQIILIVAIVCYLFSMNVFVIHKSIDDDAVIV